MSKKEKSVNCRVCLRTDSKIRKKCMSLFDKYNDYSISELINSIADVKIQKGDGLPSKICPDCLLELDTVVAFKTKCENSNVLLRTTLLFNHSLTAPKSESIKPLEEIKKEEPEEIESYIEAAYLDEDYPIEELYPETGTSNELESKVNNEDINVDKNIKKSKAIDLKLECNECGGFFKSKCKMRVHWKKVHMYESLMCQLCKRTFKSYKAFNLHAKRKSKACLTASRIRVEGTGKSRVFQCNKCSYSSLRIKDIESHLVVHTGERPFICKICRKGFTQQSSLQGHMESAHKIFLAETTCVICGKHLKGRSRIYTHMKTHSHERLQCDICKKFFKNKNTLIVHLQRHSGVRSYTCDQCAKSFYVLSALCNHRRVIHEKGKHIYRCDLCGYKAYTTTVIKRHRARHTGTNLPCLECGMFVEDAQKLAEHQKRHFGERNYPCPHCDKKYMDRKQRSKHIRKVHKCTFLMNKPIKQETTENSYSSISPYCVDNMIEVEVPP